MKLISDFHKYHESKTNKDWEHSYKCSVGYKQLSYVSQRIHLKNQWIPLRAGKAICFLSCDRTDVERIPTRA